MPPRSRFAALCLVALVLISACSPRVDLAQRRRDYDRLLDLAVRGAKVADTDGSQLQELQSQSSTPTADPYPALAADAERLRRKARALAQDAQALGSLRQRLAELGVGRETVAPQDGPAWRSYQGLDGRFRPLAAALERERRAVDDAHADFQALLSRYSISQRRARDLVTDCDGFVASLGVGLDDLRQRLEKAHAELQNLQGARAPAGLLARKGAALETLRLQFLDDRAFQARALAATQAFRAALPAQGDYDVGPGLPGKGSDLLTLQDQQAAWTRRRADFKDACWRYELLDSQPASSPGPP